MSCLSCLAPAHAPGVVAMVVSGSDLSQAVSEVRAAIPNRRIRHLHPLQQYIPGHASPVEVLADTRQQVVGLLANAARKAVEEGELVILQAHTPVEMALMQPAFQGSRVLKGTVYTPLKTLMQKPSPNAAQQLVCGAVAKCCVVSKDFLTVLK
eukprot:NODE_2632_length_665_cov_40.141234_g2164_i0.p1 GENE.NODE_2632_length_665_cov_40.141234_g2164_i0~~NODE_2632_length_665_cov_40.141234_g2164_i0.p1  ORF type:complete len:153 (-),score=30.80 NODE_2632_length_665_cov_40.141234_g2164_i0:142-600(-)